MAKKPSLWTNASFTGRTKSGLRIAVHSAQWGADLCPRLIPREKIHFWCVFGLECEESLSRLESRHSCNGPGRFFGAAPRLVLVWCGQNIKHQQVLNRVVASRDLKPHSVSFNGMYAVAVELELLFPRRLPKASSTFREHGMLHTSISSENKVSGSDCPSKQENSSKSVKRTWEKCVLPVAVRFWEMSCLLGLDISRRFQATSRWIFLGYSDNKRKKFCAVKQVPSFFSHRSWESSTNEVTTEWPLLSTSTHRKSTSRLSSAFTFAKAGLLVRFPTTMTPFRPL